jgi:hypothetical protein
MGGAIIKKVTCSINTMVLYHVTGTPRYSQAQAELELQFKREKAKKEEERWARSFALEKQRTEAADRKWVEEAELRREEMRIRREELELLRMQMERNTRRDTDGSYF